VAAWQASHRWHLCIHWSFRTLALRTTLVSRAQLASTQGCGMSMSRPSSRYADANNIIVCDYIIITIIEPSPPHTHPPPPMLIHRTALPRSIEVSPYLALASSSTAAVSLVSTTVSSHSSSSGPPPAVSSLRLCLVGLWTLRRAC
jgi:hypothetical protein